MPEDFSMPREQWKRYSWRMLTQDWMLRSPRRWIIFLKHPSAFTQRLARWASVQIHNLRLETSVRLCKSPDCKIIWQAQPTHCELSVDSESRPGFGILIDISSGKCSVISRSLNFTTGSNVCTVSPQHYQMIERLDNWDITYCKKHCSLHM